MIREITKLHSGSNKSTQQKADNPKAQELLVQSGKIIVWRNKER
jgi:hypothetical protein